MNCDHSTIVQHLHPMGKVKKLGVWVPHAISQNHRNQRVPICASLLAHHRLAHEQHRPFLFCIVTGDEKWCLYANIRKRKEWLNPKQEKNMSEMFQFLHLALHFLASTHYLQMTKLQYVNSITTIELQIKKLTINK